MVPHVLILGGTGRIGQAIAADLLQHTTSTLCLTGRRHLRSLNLPQAENRVRQTLLDLADGVEVERAIATADLVIHCAGPFHDRDLRVLRACIAQRVNYLDVCDQRGYTQQALALRSEAQAAGITAVVNTGIFPGISNSMVRQDVEALDQAEHIHLSYGVAGSGGAGLTVMRTTFLGLQQPFLVLRSQTWQSVQPYSEPETIVFPTYGPVAVYWFDMPEAWTLPQSYAVASVTTKFGSIPAVYNWLTATTARLPTAWLQRRAVIEFLAQASYRCTQISDRWSGTGLAIRSTVRGVRAGQPAQATSTLVATETAIAAGQGTGSIAQLLLTQQLDQLGVWSVEQVVPTHLFQAMMQERGLQLQQHITCTSVT